MKWLKKTLYHCDGKTSGQRWLVFCTTLHFHMHSSLSVALLQTWASVKVALSYKLAKSHGFNLWSSEVCRAAELYCLAEGTATGCCVSESGTEHASLSEQGSLHAEPLFLISPLRRFTVTALQVSVLSAALHVVSIQLHRGICGTLLLLHLLHAF